jgi:plasmid stability protein
LWKKTGGLGVMPHPNARPILFDVDVARARKGSRCYDSVAIMLHGVDPCPTCSSAASVKLVTALKERAGGHGRSAEGEHRAILGEALARPRKRTFAEVLASIPEVGIDEDFERI